MTETIACPHATSWCTQHSEYIDQCVSESVDLQGGKISLWLLAEIPGTEPVITVDAAAHLRLDRVDEFREGLARLEGLARTGASS